MNDQIKVLLIDDEIEFVTTLAERLRLRGYYVKTSNDGVSGINIIQNQSFDIVVLDLLMPGLNGVDTLRQIRKINHKLPVILLSGHGSTQEGIKEMHLGAFDYLIKPLDINVLIQKISEAVVL